MVFEALYEHWDVLRIVDFGLTLIVLLIIFFFAKFYIKRKLPLIAIGISSVVLLACSFFGLLFAAIVTAIFLACMILITYVVNIADTRIVLDNKFPSQITLKQLVKNKKVKQKSYKYYNHDDFYEVIRDAVVFFSNNKVGALLTFERNDNLDNIAKNGVFLDAPVVYELLLTIFYNGTRLHDGAVIIRDNMIRYANVFFNPSIEQTGVKRGSRHRAALGVSSETDAVTIVVSEETGAISLAINGTLRTYGQDVFLDAFKNAMEVERRINPTEEGEAVE